MPVLKEISNQFRVCVALMNDPHIMQHQPAVVADHFAAAMCKIEQLRRFLRKPDKLHDHWVDESILDVGVKKMVTAVLNKHMEPLRTNTFPEVFARDLGQWADGEKHEGENLTEREIKECNCMGAIVLLYYYLSWHVMLILLNGKAYPCSKRSAVWESELDFETFFKELPDETDMFELNYMRKLNIPDWKAKCLQTLPSSLLIDSDYNQFLVDDNDPNTKLRKAHLMNAYKSALYESNNQFEQKCWWRKQIAIGLSMSGFDEFSHVVTSLAIERRLALFGNVLSIYDLQDDTQKWRDMYVDIETQSGDTYPQEDDDDDESKFKSNTKVYRHRLAKILRNKPYATDLAAFKNNAKEAAIYDYGSATLMMDVGRAYLKSRQLIKTLLKSDSDTEDLEVDFLKFVLHVHTKNAYSRALEDLENADRAPNTFGKFVKTMINQRKSIITHDIPPDAVMVDGLAGYYWGSRPCVGEGVNHLYLAWPDIENPDLDVLKAMQTLCLRSATTISKKQVAFICILPAVRNSLFVSTSVASLKKLMDVLKCHPGLPNLDRDVHIQTFPHEGDINAYFFSQTKPSTAWPSAPQTIQSMNQSKALKILNREQEELEKRAAEASSFRKYPGISWPVRVGGTTDTNFACFEFVRPVPKIVPSLTDSAYGVRVVLGEIRDAVKGPGRRAAGGGGAPGGSALGGV